MNKEINTGMNGDEISDVTIDSDRKLIHTTIKNLKILLNTANGAPVLLTEEIANELRQLNKLLVKKDTAFTPYSDTIVFDKFEINLTVEEISPTMAGVRYIIKNTELGTSATFTARFRSKYYSLIILGVGMLDMFHQILVWHNWLIPYDAKKRSTPIILLLGILSDSQDILNSGTFIRLITPVLAGEDISNLLNRLETVINKERGINKE